jgi:glyoxylase-like metal-dependent hydrolase (beta-lactamase superfamily II)
MAVHAFGENLDLIDLDLPREGFRTFISSWLYRPGNLTILVDPGPLSTIPALLEALKKEGVDTLDYILLTHIHVDHAGGAGLLLERYPDARVICHPQGIRHMIDPAKLWEGSRKVLGDIALAYGEIIPIPTGNIAYEQRIVRGSLVIEACETPGHASHHLCFLSGEVLFTGEVAGINYPFPDGGLYLRPATPPPFSYEIYRGSLEKASLLGATRLCFGHYGSRTDAGHIFNLALEQLDNWLATVEKHRDERGDLFEERVFADLIAHDRGVHRYPELPPDIQARERYFSFNSIRGMREYLLKR